MGQTAFRAVHKVTFLDGATVSELVDIVGNKLGAIYVPAGFPGTTITFLTSPNPGPGSGELPFLPVTDDAGLLYAASILGGETAVLEATGMAVAPPRWLKLVTNNAPSGDVDLYLLTTN